MCQRKSFKRSQNGLELEQLAVFIISLLCEEFWNHRRNSILQTQNLLSDPQPTAILYTWPKRSSSFALVCPEGGGDKESSCPYWKKLKFCEPSKGYADFMKKTCPASCEICQGSSFSLSYFLLSLSFISFLSDCLYPNNNSYSFGSQRVLRLHQSPDLAKVLL